MLGRLHDLLARLLEDQNSQELPLRRELECVRLYLAIQEVRFRDRLRVEITAEPELLDSPVMSMCLQPLVENAIRHGIARKAGSGTIRVSANRAPGGVKLQVEDDGVGIDASKALHRSGIGLANIRARLLELYGELSSLSVQSRAQGGTLVTITLPYSVGAIREGAGEIGCS
jgi:sensor histidine kinase YesM